MVKGDNQNMTEKELHRLKRPDLLTLLVAQGREAGEMQQKLSSTENELHQADRQVERLKARLNDKDEQLNRLKEKLQDKDAQIARLKDRLDTKDARIVALEAQLEDLISGRFSQLQNADSLREIAQRLDLMLRTAQAVADSYFKNVLALPIPAGHGAPKTPAPAAKPEQPPQGQWSLNGS